MIIKTIRVWIHIPFPPTVSHDTPEPERNVPCSDARINKISQYRTCAFSYTQVITRNIQRFNRIMNYSGNKCDVPACIRAGAPTTDTHA